MKKKKQSNIKVTVHYQGWQSAKGVSRKYREYHVIAGANPFGPRGGRQGVAVDGERVAGRFNNIEAAQEAGKQYAEKFGYEYIE